MSDRMTVAIQCYAAALASAQQSTNAHGLRKLLEEQAVVLGVAPRKNSGLDRWLQRGGFVFDAVIAAQKAKLIGIHGLHRAFPGTNLFAEDAGYVRDRMKIQVTADVLIA